MEDTPGRLNGLENFDAKVGSKWIKWIKYRTREEGDKKKKKKEPV